MLVAFQFSFICAGFESSKLEGDYFIEAEGVPLEADFQELAGSGRKLTAVRSRRLRRRRVGSESFTLIAGIII